MRMSDLHMPLDKWLGYLYAELRIIRHYSGLNRELGWLWNSVCIANGCLQTKTIYSNLFFHSLFASKIYNKASNINKNKR